MSEQGSLTPHQYWEQTTPELVIKPTVFFKQVIFMSAAIGFIKAFGIGLLTGACAVGYNHFFRHFFDTPVIPLPLWQIMLIAFGIMFVFASIEFGISNAPKIKNFEYRFYPDSWAIRLAEGDIHRVYYADVIAIGLKTEQEIEGLYGMAHFQLKDPDALLSTRRCGLFKHPKETYSQIRDLIMHVNPAVNEFQP